MRVLLCGHVATTFLGCIRLRTMEGPCSTPGVGGTHRTAGGGTKGGVVPVEIEGVARACDGGVDVHAREARRGSPKTHKHVAARRRRTSPTAMGRILLSFLMAASKLAPTKCGAKSAWASQGAEKLTASARFSTTELFSNV